MPFIGPKIVEFLFPTFLCPSALNILYIYQATLKPKLTVLCILSGTREAYKVDNTVLCMVLSFLSVWCNQALQSHICHSIPSSSPTICQCSGDTAALALIRDI